jgi:hypothetical protein
MNLSGNVEDCVGQYWFGADVGLADNPKRHIA